MNIYIVFEDSGTCLPSGIDKIFLSGEKADEYLSTKEYGFYLEEHEVNV